MGRRKQNIIIENKALFVLLILLSLILMIIIGIFLGNLIYKNVRGLATEIEDMNILYLGETKIDKEEEVEVLQVEIEEPKSEGNQVVSSTDTNTNIKPDVKEPKKKQDIPYYIKVNNQANVVTVYKKDANRKIYSTI